MLSCFPGAVSHVTERLLSRSISVIGLESYHPFYPAESKARNIKAAREHPAFLEVRGDVRDPEGLARLPDEIDTIIHFAALAGVRPSMADPLRYQSVNVQGTSEPLEWARHRRTTNVVFASSSSVYGTTRAVPFTENADVRHPISPYAATKVTGELLCHTYHHLHDISSAVRVSARTSRSTNSRDS